MSAPESTSELHENESAHGSTLAAISRRMVGLIKDYYGKGPSNARTYHWGELVVVLLSGGSTSVEKTLIADGQEQAVIDQRTAFQDAMRPRYKRVIEEEMQREVIAFMSAYHNDPDINAEIFVLAPRDGAEEPSAPGSEQD
ncbi:MAG TPA: Na-translocating system protein MpsC family protein [Solirubrobacteraceae bacterium]|nr:Na-translocating system protein MpsC family protein [Solirubrobacteraceae bacterium]